MLKSTSILFGADHIFGHIIQIWKDVGHIYFWSSGQSISLILNYFNTMTRAMLGTPASVNIYRKIKHLNKSGICYKIPNSVIDLTVYFNCTSLPVSVTFFIIPYFIECSVYTSIVRTFILQFSLNTLFMNKVGECYLPSIVRSQYFSIIFNTKSVPLYLIKFHSI
jgi:hypothetical protein